MSMYYNHCMNQTRLPFQLKEEAMKTFLENASSRKLSLVLTDNSTSMLSIKEKKGVVIIRLHKMFLGAGNDVLNEIANHIKRNRKRTPLIREFINRNNHILRKSSQRKITIRTKGRYHDLQEIYHFINREYFSENISAAITWGAKSPKLAAAKRTLGSYSYNNNIIRINPRLDSIKVPRYYMEFLVYHEMLHADLGVDATGGRNFYHTREFRRREKLFKHHDRVLKLEKRDKAT